jgi:hypothetical protein
MKAKNEQTSEQGIVLLIPDKTIRGKFGNVSKEITRFQSYVEIMKIDDEDTLKIAENNAGLVKDSINSIEKVRKELKQPYFDTGKTIDSIAKEMTAPLDTVKAKITDEITNYKNLQAAIAAQAAEKAAENANKLADEKAAEIERISRIESQITARLYGGHWFNSNKQRKDSAGCLQPVDCENLLSTVNEKIPSIDEFTHMKDQYSEMTTRVKKKINEFKINLIESMSRSQTVKDNALKQIEEKRGAGQADINNQKDELKQEVIDENRKTIKAATNEVSAATKGVRKTLVIEVDDIEKVPKEWLLINEVKIREWASENKIDLKDKISKEGSAVVNGIKFTLSSKYVSR